MKASLCLCFALLTQAAFAQLTPGEKAIKMERIQSESGLFDLPKIGYCRYEINGKNIPKEEVIEEKLMDFKECKSKARRFLDTAESAYDRLNVKHQSQAEWILIKK